MKSTSILQFWFEEIDKENWFKKNEAFDTEIITRFTPVHHVATLGELFTWRESIEGRLAEIIVLDQFSRNMFRNDPRSFAYDSMALVLAQDAVATGQAQSLPAQQRSFLYMPYMHSESLLIHDEAMKLFSEAGLEHNLDFEIRHRDIIARFGRYPHRNALLGRVSTEEELAFLQEPGSSF